MKFKPTNTKRLRAFRFKPELDARLTRKMLAEKRGRTEIVEEVLDASLPHIKLGGAK